jgi:excisionase family DNA binding protein
MINTEEFIPIRDAARLTGYTAEYIRRLARDNRVEHCKIGNIVLVRKEALLRHKQEQDAIRDLRKSEQSPTA